MKGGKAGRKRRPSPSGEPRKAVMAVKKSTALKKGERRKPFGGRASSEQS